MKIVKNCCLILAGVVASTLVSGCNLFKKMTETEALKYDEYSTDYDPNVDSWEQIADDDEDVDITWWIDSPDWSFYHVDRLIKKRTGVNVKFESALKDDGTELSTMMAGTMKDVITITDYRTRTQLANEGYVYALDRLAESYAPSMLKRVSEEQKAYYSASDGHFYGVANNFYNDADIAEYEESGNKILSNYAVVVRKDMLNAYLSYRKGLDPTFNENTEVTTAGGFIEMAKWVKQNFNLKDDNPTVCMSEFPLKASNGSISSGLSCLMEYFNASSEGADGNLQYEYATNEFKEVLYFLNDLYANKLFISANLSYGKSDIVTHIKNGRPFAVIGAIQNYSTGFAAYSAEGYNSVTGTFSDDHEYVPIVITNSKHQAPILGSLAGRGLRVSMITKDAKRVDRIIKVFDYLMSEQGQREVYYGEVEGEYYNFTVRPGETKQITVDGKTINHTYQYGQVEWTQKAKDLLGASNSSGWMNAGIKAISLLCNPMYVSLTSKSEAEMDTYQFYVRYNQKCALLPYTNSRMGFKYNVDISDEKKYNEMVNIQANCEEVWIKAMKGLIMAANHAAVDSKYNEALKLAENKGYKKLLEYRNPSFLANKATLKMAYAYPLNDSSYVAPEVKLQGFYDTYKKDLPNYIAIKE